MAGVTISTTDVQRDFNLDWVDTVGAEHTTEPLPPGYSGVTWSADDEGLLVSLAPFDTRCTVKIIGPAGTFNLKAVSKKQGAPDMVGTLAVTIAGPAPSHLNVLLAPLA
jgi:hypothetical protein